MALPSARGVTRAGTSSSRWTTTLLVRVGELANRTLVLPLLVFYATSRCNSRCLSCDWWKSDGADDLTIDEVEAVARELPGLGTRVVVFSGGEPLVRPHVFRLAAAFRAYGAELHLLTSGVLLDRHAADVARHFARVTVSLDGADAGSYHAIRGVDALHRVEAGVGRLRVLAPGLPITARATLHRANFWQMPKLVARARELGVDRISFLAADLTSAAFGRGADGARRELALDRADVPHFRTIVERTLRDYAAEVERGFIAESPDRLRALPTYYAALLGDEPYPPVACNAPSISVVLEADGSVRPCFFHPPIGNVRESRLSEIVTAALPVFRRELDMARDGTCIRCVCSMKTGWRHVPW